MNAISWQRILATTDFSPFGNSAVEYAHELAEMFGAELHVLHVARNVDAAGQQFGTSGLLEPGAASDSELEWLARLYGETGTIRRINAVVIGSDAAEKIVHYAKAHAIDLVVMASHGRTGMKHLLLGSVAEKVVRSLHCPVLVLRPDGKDAQVQKASLTSCEVSR